MDVWRVSSRNTVADCISWAKSKLALEIVQNVFFFLKYSTICQSYVYLSKVSSYLSFFCCMISHILQCNYYNSLMKC